MRTEKDMDIATLICEKKEEGLKAIFELYFDELFNYVYKLVNNKEDSEDILQVVLMDLWQNANKREIKELKSYLFSMAKFQVYKFWSNKVDVSSLMDEFEEIESEECLISQLECNELEDEIQRAVDDLPNSCRQIFELSKIEGLSHDEITAKLNISKQTVKNQLSKALLILKAKININYTLIIPFLFVFIGC